jgi:hypothetical protein
MFPMNTPGLVRTLVKAALAHAKAQFGSGEASAAVATVGDAQPRSDGHSALLEEAILKMAGKQESFEDFVSGKKVTFEEFDWEHEMKKAGLDILFDVEVLATWRAVTL